MKTDGFQPRLTSCLLLALVVGVWTSLGEIHRYHNADSLVPVLCSLQHWTFYYWQQNRFGMLVPLLASPIEHPLANLIFQNAITAWAGIAAIFLMARYLFRDETWLFAAGLGAAGFLLWAPDAHRFQYLSTFQPYNVSLCLGFAGLVVSGFGKPSWWRQAGALALLLPAVWVNGALVLLLLPLVVFRGLLTRSHPLAAPVATSDSHRPLTLLGRRLVQYLGTEAVVEGTLLSLALVAAKAAQDLSPYQTTQIVLPAADKWAGLCQEMAIDVFTALAPHHLLWFLGILSVAGLALWTSKQVRTDVGAALRALAAVVLASLCYGVVMAVMFEAHERYFLPALMLLTVAFTGLAVKPFFVRVGSLRCRVALSWAAFPLLLAATAFVNHWPSVARVRADVDRTLGTLTDDLLATDCTHVAGDYWTVWPAVFHANLTLAERAEQRTIWGLSHRSFPTRLKWDTIARGDVRIGATLEDAQVDQYLSWYGFLPVKTKTTTSKIHVLVPQTEAGQESPTQKRSQ